MTSLKIAAFLIALLSWLNSAKANETGLTEHNQQIRRQVVQQFTLSPEEARLVQNTTIRFYYKLDSSGKVRDVIALTPDKATRSMLEKHFRSLQLSPVSPALSGRIDIRFRMD